MRKTKLLLLLLPLLLLHACSGGEPPEIIPTDAVVTPVQDGGDQMEPVLNDAGEPPAYEPEITLPDESPPSRTLDDPSTIRTDPVLHASVLPDAHDGFELPVDGAAGYASIDIRRPNIPAGTPFTILEETGDGLSVRLADGSTATVDPYECLVNLPDVLPSVVYDAVNGYASMFRSCGKPLDGITGQALYPGKAWNDRLGRDEYMMPVLYPMARTLAVAQRAALEDGNTLVLYEGFRPAKAQRAVADALKALAQTDGEVAQAVSGPPWSVGWFIATSTSNHQRGYAVDASLARVLSAEERYVSGWRYLSVTGYALYDMPTQMHELSPSAAAMAWPVDGNSATAWESVPPADTMNGPAMALQRYCTGAGLTPLASEWWHFNDLSIRRAISGRAGKGEFQIQEALSREPAPPA